VIRAVMLRTMSWVVVIFGLLVRDKTTIGSQTWAELCGS
jgi:hypothetical protein